MDILRRNIIAVFGGSKMKGETESEYEQRLKLAERLGSAIVARDAIVLTGGTEPAEAPVKNRAILGAVASDRAALWIGVDRIDKRVELKKEKPESHPEGSGGFVIRSTLDHHRNYLEAAMADAAICLEGGGGTVSEMTFSLCLGRPVALVGDRWLENYDLSASTGLEKAIKETQARFKNSQGKHNLDPDLYDAATLRGRLVEQLGVPGAYRYFGSDASVVDVLGWIKSVVPDVINFPGFFPDLPEHGEVKGQYEQWLKHHA